MKKIIPFLYIAIIVVITYFIIFNDNKNITDEDILYVETEAVTIKETQEVEELDTYIIEFIDDNYTTSLYEPVDKCYIGAYILSNKYLDFDITKYEELIEKDHATYLYHMNLGERIPDEWILECIANMKTPSFVINPPNNLKPYQQHLLEDMIKSFSQYYVPMFVHFYPNPSEINGTNKEYILFYQKVYSMFKKYAPNVALVWSIKKENIMSSHLFYPGDDFLDWIGLNVYINSDEYYKKELNFLDRFNEIYGMKKPLMISQLAISHFSKNNHKYYIKPASQLIHDIYNIVPQKYKNIKSINYLDFNHIDISNTGTENYMITDDEYIMNTYSNAVRNPYYLGNIEDDVNSKKIKKTYRIKAEVLNKNNKYYIDENAKNKMMNGECKFTIEYKEKTYIELIEILDQNDNRATIDKENKIIYVNQR